MSDQRYPIIDFSFPTDIMETVGSRRKFWILNDSGEKWLLKFPRPRTGEHWAERVAAEIGRLIGVATADVELARVGNQLATVCRSFLPDDGELDDPDSPIYTWFHGREFLNLVIDDYDIHLVRHNRAHNVKNIINVVLEIAESVGIDSSGMITDLASYAVLDGLIGNTDRHHENWMVILEDYGEYDRMYVAPSFDHASSLGRELLDERRERLLDSPTGVLSYLKKGRGGVFIDSNRTHAPSPLSLTQLLWRRWPEEGRTWFERLSSIRDTELRSIIDKIPPEFMSDTAREFAYQVVVTSKAELLRSIR